MFKPVTPVSFYGASNDKDLDDKLAYMVESNGVFVRTELHKVKCEQEMKVQKEIKRIEDGKKRLLALKRNKVTKYAYINILCEGISISLRPITYALHRRTRTVRHP